MISEPYQVMPPLDDDQLHALRQSIKQHGILQPIEVDEDGSILDGHHRAKIADELGIDCPQRVVSTLADDDEKRRYALTVNVARRHLTPAKRAELVTMLRGRGLSQRAIGSALGISAATVNRTLAAGVSDETPRQVSHVGHLPDKVTGADGKTYAATRPQPAAQPEPTPDPRLPEDEPFPGLGPAEPELPTGACPECVDQTCDVHCVDCGGVMADHCPECEECTCTCDPTEGVGEQYRTDPAERIAAVAEVAPEHVRPIPETPARRDPDPTPGPAVATTGGPATTPAPKPDQLDDPDGTRRAVSSARVADGLVALRMAIGMDPIRWLTHTWQPDQFMPRDVPHAREAFTPAGLRCIAASLVTLAEHLERTGASL